jgi:hypothetical protein
MIGLEPESTLSPLEPCEDPFQLRDVSDPFALLGNACIVSDLAQQVLPLFMLIQRSDYSCSPEEARLNTNLSIDQRWQQILSVFLTPSFNDLHLLLAEQIGKQGQLLQFHSLFYCRAKQSFFHPPCPGCGKELIVCTDETLLSRHSLEGYSTSLRRFLYCPLCCSDSSPIIYYVPKRQQNDPDCVGNVQQLMRSWARLQPVATADTSLPCHSCPGNKACFGRNLLAVNTLCSFSFYPFYMLLLKTDSEQVFDFKALLSGKAQAQECIISKSRPAEPEIIPESTQPEDSGHVLETHIPKAFTSADAAIHDILADILTQWENADESTKQPPVTGEFVRPSNIPFPQQKEDLDLRETVILGSTPLSQNGEHPPENRYRETQPSSDFRPADTIQIHPSPPEGQTTKKETFDVSLAKLPDDYLQETIILSPQPGQQVQGNLKPSPLTKDTGAKTANNQQSPIPNRKGIDVDLAETLIQMPGKKP